MTKIDLTGYTFANKEYPPLNLNKIEQLRTEILENAKMKKNAKVEPFTDLERYKLKEIIEISFTGHSISKDETKFCEKLIQKNLKEYEEIEKEVKGGIIASIRGHEK